MVANVKFSLGFYFFLDVAVYSHSSKNGSHVHITFIDWIPGICSCLGMLVINTLEKSRLDSESYGRSSNSEAWKARLVLFLGFALIAGGLAGSLVRSYSIVTSAVLTYRRLWSSSTSSRNIPFLHSISVSPMLLPTGSSCSGKQVESSRGP